MQINRDNKTAVNMSYGSTQVTKMYRGDTVVYGEDNTQPSAPAPCFAVTSDITTYTDTTYVDVYDKKTEKWYKLNNLGQYERYGVLSRYNSAQTTKTGWVSLSEIDNTIPITKIKIDFSKVNSVNGVNVLLGTVAGISLPTNAGWSDDTTSNGKPLSNRLWINTKDNSSCVFNNGSQVQIQSNQAYTFSQARYYNGYLAGDDYSIWSDSVEIYTTSEITTVGNTSIDDITYYTGKLIIFDGHEYKHNGTQWVDLGELTNSGFQYWMWYYTDSSYGDGALEYDEFDLVDEQGNDYDLTAIAANPEGLSNETYPNLFDNSITTKWCHAKDNNSNYVIWQTDYPVSPVKFVQTTGYHTSASNYRNAKHWYLFGSNTETTDKNDSSWVQILDVTDTQKNMSSPSTRYDFEIDTSVYGQSSSYLIKYDTKVAPSNNVTYDTLAELQLMECPWVGMKAKVGSDNYIYTEEGWTKQTRYIEIDLNDQWRESTKTLDGYDVYESNSNYNVNNGYASIKVTWFGYPDFGIYINSYAESSWDYTIAWAMDKDAPTSNPSTSTSGVKAHTQSKQYNPTSISNFTYVDYTNDGEEHFAWITYRKDASSHVSDDRGRIAILQYDDIVSTEWKLSQTGYTGSNGTYYQKLEQYAIKTDGTEVNLGISKQGTERLSTVDRIAPSEYLTGSTGSVGSSSYQLKAYQKVYKDVITPDGVQRQTGYYVQGSALEVTDYASSAEYLGSNPYYEKRCFTVTAPNGLKWNQMSSYYKQGDQLESVNRLSTTEYIKSGDNYYEKIYVDPITPDGTQRATTNYIQGEQLTSYTQDDGDTKISNYKKYHKLWVYVTVDGNAVKTSDWVLGDYIEDVTSRLPEGYTEVEYIEHTAKNSSTDCCNLKFWYQFTDDIEMKFNYPFDSSYNYSALYGAARGDNTTYPRCHIMCQQAYAKKGSVQYGYSPNGEFVLSSFYNTDTIVTHTNTGVTFINSSTALTYSYDSSFNFSNCVECTVTMTLWTKNKYAYDDSSLTQIAFDTPTQPGKIFYFKTTNRETNQLTHHFVAAKNSDDVYGFYDIITDTWCPVSGTNSNFTCGEEGIFY